MRERRCAPAVWLHRRARRWRASLARAARGPSRSSTACSWRSKPARQLGSCGSAHPSSCTAYSLPARSRTTYAPRPRHGRDQDGGQQARRPHRRPAATLPTGGRRATHDRGGACDCRCADRFRRADLDRARRGRTAAHRRRAHPQASATPTRPLARIGTRDVGRSGLVNGPFAIEEPVRSLLPRRTLVRRKSSSPPLCKKARAFRPTRTDREQRLCVGRC